VKQPVMVSLPIPIFVVDLDVAKTEILRSRSLCWTKLMYSFRMIC